MFKESDFSQELDKRLSDISTLDCSMSGEESSPELSCFLLDPARHYHLFNRISDEQKYIYFRLQNGLQSLYSRLTQELEPVSVREHCTLMPKSVNLVSISSSCIKKRRVVSSFN